MIDAFLDGIDRILAQMRANTALIVEAIKLRRRTMSGDVAVHDDTNEGITAAMIQAGADVIRLDCEETHVWSAHVAARVYLAMRAACGIIERPVEEPEGLKSEMLARKRPS